MDLGKRPGAGQQSAQSPGEEMDQGMEGRTVQNMEEQTVQSAKEATAQNKGEQIAQEVEEVTAQSEEKQTMQNVEETVAQGTEGRTAQSVEEATAQSGGEQTVQGARKQVEQGMEEATAQGPEEQTAQWEKQHTESHETTHIDHHIEQHNPVHAPIPGLGFRSIKTALAAVFTALLYAFLPNSNPTFACIGAIFGMGADMEESRRSGGNRFFGTVIGGFIGLGLYWLEHQAYPEGCYWLRLPMVFLGIIALISMCVLFHWPGGVQPGGVVLCIILFNTPAHHIDYAIHRMIDTGIGVIIALLVNYFLPRSRLERWFHLDQERKKTVNRKV